MEQRIPNNIRKLEEEIKLVNMKHFGIDLSPSKKEAHHHKPIHKHSMDHIPELWAMKLAKRVEQETLIREKYPEVFQQSESNPPEKLTPKKLNQTRYDRKVDREPRNKEYKPSLLERIFKGKSSRNENDKRRHYNKGTG